MNRDLSFNLVRRIMDLNQYLGMMNADASFIRILIADQSSESCLEYKPNRYRDLVCVDIDMLL